MHASGPLLPEAADAHAEEAQDDMLSALKRFGADRFLRDASVASFCQILGVITGFALDATVLAYFGLGVETDAYFAAMAIPLLATNTLAVQVPKVLVPLFARSFNDEASRAGEVLWQLLWLALITGGVLSSVAVLFCGALIRVQVPGLPMATVRVAINIARIGFWLVALRVLTTILRCRLFSERRFALGASNKVLANGVALGVLVLFHTKWGIEAVAAGLLAGEGLVAVAMLVALVAVGSGPRISRITGLHEEVRSLGRLLLLPMGGHFIGESRTLVENFALSFLGGGALSAMRYASRIIQAVSGILVGGIMTTTLPALSVLAAERQWAEMKSALLRGVRLLALAALPVSVWLAITSDPLLMLLYGRGEFTAADAALPAALIAWLTPYILVSRLSGLIQVPFLSVLDFRTPFVSTVLSVSVHLLVLVCLLHPCGIWTFPAAAIISSAASLSYLIRAFLRRFGGIDWVKLGTFGWRLGSAGALCAAGCAGGGLVAGQFISLASIPPVLLAASASTVLGGIAFLAGLSWTGLLALTLPSFGVDRS